MKMKLKLIVAASTLAFLMGASSTLLAAPVMAIQVYNNLYNQAAVVAGMTPSTITVQFFNGATQCDSALVGFRALVSELVGTGAGQKCPTVSSVKIIGGPSSISTALQVYSATAVTVSITTTDFEHSIIVQDIGTGVAGTPASDGSIAPVFNASNGTVSAQGILGTILQESKLIP